MLKRATLSVVVAGVLVFCASCKGSETTAVSDTPPPPPPGDTPAPIPTAAASGTEVASYPTMVAQGGNVKLVQAVKVYQAADPNSTVITRLGVGTVVERKSSYGDWMLINWPSGVGQLSPGWVQASFLGSVVQPQLDGGVADSGTPAPVDAGAPADAGTGVPRPSLDAGAPATDGGKRPAIFFPGRK